MQGIDSIAAFLSLLFQNLKQSSIQYAVLRNYQSLPNSTGDSDIDMWVNKADFGNCLSIFRKVSQSSQLNLVSYYGDETSIKICLLKENFGVQFDLFNSAIYYKERILASGESIVRHSFPYNGITVTEDKYSELLAYLKELINNITVKEKYTEPIIDNKNEYSLDYLKQNLKNFDEKFIYTLFHSISASTIVEESSHLAKLCRSSLSTDNRVCKTSILASKIKRFFGPNPGYNIVVEGTDGSGKSFIINSITPILNEAFHNGVIYNHLRPHCIPDIAELFGKRKKTTKAPNHVVTDPHAEKPSGFVGSLVRWLYYMIDYTFGYLRKVWLPIHSKSKVFIFDRYYYEYYLDQRRSHVNLPMWIIRLGEFFIPKPDLILCLGGDPEKIYARKPETSLQEVTRQTMVLKDFCSKRKNAVWIDTTVAPEESINAAMKAIIEMMSKRFNIADLQ